MSIKRMTAVWELSSHKGSQLLLMLALADNANDLGVCWPGYAYIARKIRMSSRQALRLAATCNESGELWTLNRPEQRSNINIVIPGLTRDELGQAKLQALKMGAFATTGSDTLSVPPQVLEVVTRCHHLTAGSDNLSGGSDIAVSVGSDIAMSVGSDIAMSHDPSLTVTDPSGTVMDALAFDWQAALRELKPGIPAATFNQWFRGSTATRENGVLTIHTRYQYADQGSADRLRPQVLRALHLPDDDPLAVRFEVAT